MDQSKIGQFIAACRKEQRLTQAALAEKLGITDRAVSKWENGRSMPDSSIMVELCELLDISVNELLTGERIAMKDYELIAEENLLSMRKQTEETNQRLLTMENVIGFGATIAFLILTVSACFAVESKAWQIAMIAAACVIFAVGLYFALKLEREVGWYQCAKCRHRYVPTWKSHLWAMHLGKTRFMKCPECGRWSWQTKTLTKEENEHDKI